MNNVFFSSISYKSEIVLNKNSTDTDSNISFTQITKKINQNEYLVICSLKQWNYYLQFNINNKRIEHLSTVKRFFLIKRWIFKEK